MTGNAVRLARIETLGFEEFVEALVDAIGDGVQQLATLFFAHPGPWASERGTCGLDGSIDVFARCLVYDAERVSGARIDIGKRRRTGRLAVLAIDEVPHHGIAASGVCSLCCGHSTLLR